MQESLGGPEAYKNAFLEKLQQVRESGEDLTVHAVLEEIRKKGDGSTVSDGRAIAQKQEGLYTVMWHPLGGLADPEKFCAVNDALQKIEGAEMRLAPDETAYIINLTGSEAKQILELTDDSAKTPFEASVSCIGASVCQVGVRDSQGLLAACVEAVRKAGLPASALPKIHISGCPSSCGTHQTGEMGFRGGVKKIDGKVCPAFVLYADGCDYQGKETMGAQLGTIEETKIPEFLVTLGQHVAESGMEFHEWRQKNPEMLEKLAKPYLE